MSELRQHWKVVFACALGAAAGITGMSVYALSVLIGPLSEAFDWSRAEVSGAKTILTAGFVITGPFVGYLADRIGVRKIGILSLAMLSVGMYSMTQIGPDIRYFYLALFMLAVAGCGTTALVWTRAVASWFRETRGLALALTLTGPGVAGVIPPTLLDSHIQRYGWRAACIAIGTFAALPQRGDVEPAAAAAVFSGESDRPSGRQGYKCTRPGHAFRGLPSRGCAVPAVLATWRRIFPYRRCCLRADGAPGPADN